MIKKIRVRQYQSHDDTEIELHPGFNVITGDSDSGKTAILRAVRWIMFNRPRSWEDFKPWGNKKPVSEVELELDNGIVTRKRSSTINSYETKGDDFQVVKDRVPEKVKQVLNMDNDNIERQHDTYFLLQDSPGEVATKLNEVAGLEIIDKVTDSIDSIVRSTMSSYSTKKEQVQVLTQSLKEYDYLPSVEELIIKINSLWSEVTERKKIIDLLTEKTKQYFSLEKERHSVAEFLVEAEPPYQNMLALIQAIEKAGKSIKYLDSAISSYKAQEGEALNIRSFLSLSEGIYLKALDITKEMKKIELSKIMLDNALQSYNVLLEASKQAKAQYLTKKKEYQDLLMQSKICPVCGGQVTSKTINNFLGAL